MQDAYTGDELTDRSFVYLDEVGAIHVRVDNMAADFTFQLAARVEVEGVWEWVQRNITVAVHSRDYTSTAGVCLSAGEEVIII